MLSRLVLEYLPIYLSDGDKAAKDCFTNNEYSARESDTVTGNKELMRHRQFNLDGVVIEMAKHLKIGVADDPSRTIRVHFGVLQQDKKIAIGHCGTHLPLPER